MIGMSDIILISKVGLYETIKCAICKNPNQTERGCDGSCQYDKELHAKIVEAVMGIAEKRPHGEWIYHKEWYSDGECAYECSRCGMGADVDYNFCPNCGLPMNEKALEILRKREGDPE